MKKLLLNVLPSFPGKNFIDNAFRNSKFFCNESGAKSVFCSDIPKLKTFGANSFYFLNHWISQLANTFVAPLKRAIQRVVVLTSNKKMVRVNARRCITCVTYGHLRRYFSISNFPRHSVRWFRRISERCFERKTPVSSHISSPSPKPARFCLFYKFKEAFINRARTRLIATLPAFRRMEIWFRPKTSWTRSLSHLGIVALLCFPVYGDQVSSAKFRGLNNNESSLIIGPEWASDLLNVDVTPGGKSVKKRPGYGVYKTLTSVQGLHGGYHFFDSSGNDVQVWGSSVSLYGIVADATATRLISSATANSTWDCADTQGNAYCVDSNRDAYVRTNGATINWYTTPLGTMVEATPDRVAVAGVTGSLSTIYLSGSNAFTTFTAGPLSTDPFTEVIAAPGSKLTHLRWGCGKLLWWKDQSFGWFSFEDQYTAQIKIVSDNIGTFDNTSAIDPGGTVWFRGQDGHIYTYDCSGLERQSIEITPFIQASGRRTSNFWTQTSQSDFQTGSSSPTVPAQPLSFTISPGDVVPSSFNVTETTTSWNTGTVSNTTVGTSSITMTLNNSGTVLDPSFETSLAVDWVQNQAFVNTLSTLTAAGLTCGTLNPQSGTFFLAFQVGGTPTHTATFEAIDTANSLLQSVSIPGGSCTTSWTQASLTPTASNLGKRVKFRFHMNDSFNGDTYVTTQASYIWGGAITFYYVDVQAANNILSVDNIQNGSSTITTGTFTSKAFNTGLPYSAIFASATWSVDTTTPSFILQKSGASGGPWVEFANSTGTNLNTNRQFVRYISTFTITSSDNARSAITGVQLIAMSSGTYYSAWKSAPSLSAWSTFNANKTNNGDDISFAIRVATETSFAVLNSTPGGVAQTNGALVSASTGTYFQVIATFTVTAATNTPSSLQDFTVNWYDGSASDQAYGLFFDNAIWFSVAYGVGVSSNTYIFKRDLINDAWTVYNFGAGGMLVQNNHLFFGDVSTGGNVFQYGSGTSDNGSTITSYWKTKDFGGSDPFLENNYTNLDSYWGRNANQSATVSYALNASTTTTSYTVSLSSTTQSVIRSKKNLPTGVNGSTINVKFGDTSSSSAWELFLYRLMFTPYPYKPG